MFASKDIPKHIFLCEYKTTKLYSKNEYTQRNFEYEMNNEICTAVEAKIEGNLHYSDATRRYIQFGRYINHSTAPNIRPHPPIFIRGKYHLGFTSTVDIPSGDELVWDYIFRDKESPWLGKSNEDKAIFTLMIFTINTYS